MSLRAITTEQARKLAAEKYAQDSDDDIEIDELLFESDFSQGDEGCWVRAWVWLEGVQVSK